MSTGRISITQLVGVSLAVTLLASEPVFARALTTGIWKVMRDGGFDVQFDDEEDTITPIGDMDVGRWHYRFMNYEHLESKQHMVPGGVQHGGNMLVVFERTKGGLVYLGRYQTWGDLPKVAGRTLVFPYKDPLGMHVDRTVTFDDGGLPPQIFLDGTVFPLQKGIAGQGAGK